MFFASRVNCTLCLRLSLASAFDQCRLLGDVPYRMTPSVGSSVRQWTTADFCVIPAILSGLTTNGGSLSGKARVLNEWVSLNVGPFPSASIDETVKSYAVDGLRPVTRISCRVVRFSSRNTRYCAP